VCNCEAHDAQDAAAPGALSVEPPLCYVCLCS
jgi:hypothetical protein